MIALSLCGVLTLSAAIFFGFVAGNQRGQTVPLFLFSCLAGLAGMGFVNAVLHLALLMVVGAFHSG